MTVTPIIDSIDIVKNEELETKFKEFKLHLQADNSPIDEILAYHGTAVENIDNILNCNLQISYSVRRAHGKGMYFSEFPNVSLRYGQGLVLCRILPGKEFVGACSSDIPLGFHSKKIRPNADQSGSMIIVTNSDQILPAYVIHLTKSSLF